MMSDTDRPSNGGRPVSDSKSTHPKAQMSACSSTASPRACSGAIRRGPENDPVSRGGRARHRGRMRQRCSSLIDIKRLGKTKVGYLDPASVNFDIGRLEIAMHDARGVGRLDRLGDLCADGYRLCLRQRTLGDQLGQRRAVDELQDKRLMSPASSTPWIVAMLG